MSRSREGFLWTAETQTDGLETDAVTSSSQSVANSYDVVVIGAGFAGLIAARDMSRNGDLKVLLVEARDRIGGRTWTAKALGESFEMGGTWVHWNQPHVYRELHRYSLHDELKTSNGTFTPSKVLYKSAGSSVDVLDIASTFESLEKIAAAMFEIDGYTSRTLMPWPHAPTREPRPWRKYDNLTIRQRLDQLSGFSEREKEVFESNINTLGTGTGNDIGFVELLRWYSLGGHSIAQMYELCGVYKVGAGGMTALARGIFSEYRGDVLMDSTVRSIEQTNSGTTTLRLKYGRKISARAVVSTIPLNCLSDIDFSPPLSPLRKQAAQQGQICKAAKIHFKLSTADEPWFGTSDGRSGTLPYCFAFSDHNGTKGPNQEQATYCIGFGFNGCLENKKDNKEIIDAFKDCFKPDTEVQAYLTHDWASDPFAKGAWCCWGPGSMSKYLEQLQKPHGNIFFASADWADGWRGFVDGAIERGSKAARDVLTALKQEQ